MTEIAWKKVASAPPAAGFVVSGNDGMATAIKRLRKDHTRIDWAISHRAGFKKHFARAARGWQQGSLVVDQRVATEKTIAAQGLVERHWPHDYRVEPSHMRYAVMSGGEGSAVTWMGTASLVSYGATPEWWITAEGDWLRDRTDEPLAEEGCWIAEHTGLTVRDIWPSPLRYWLTYYAHPDVTLWAEDQGCNVAICSNQARRNPGMAPRHPGAVRQWHGHAKVLVYDDAVILTSLNGSLKPSRVEQSILIRGDSAIRASVEAMWPLLPAFTDGSHGAARAAMDAVNKALAARRLTIEHSPLKRPEIPKVPATLASRMRIGTDVVARRRAAVILRARGETYAAIGRATGVSRQQATLDVQAAQKSSSPEIIDTVMAAVIAEYWDILEDAEELGNLTARNQALHGLRALLGIDKVIGQRVTIEHVDAWRELRELGRAKPERVE